MLIDFMNDLKCIRQDEDKDYQTIVNSWRHNNINVLFMPSITWYSGIVNLFDKKAGDDGRNMIWLIPAGQSDYFWLQKLKNQITKFYYTDEIDIGSASVFPGIEAEKFEECILLRTDALQSNPEYTVLGANVILFRFSTLSGKDALFFILLDHQNQCWKHIIESYRIPLKWFVDSGRGTEDYFVRTHLYELMKQTPYPEVLPVLYFKGLYNKGEIPEKFQFKYAMLSQHDSDGYDKWKRFSGVYYTSWNA